MNALLDLNKSTTDTQIAFVQMAVLKVMLMNTQLYTFLQSSTFDVPVYERRNIRYNAGILNSEYDDYASVGYNNPDFRFHQKWLEEHIKDNRRIRQNVRECREMYADKHNPLYSRKKYSTKEVFPDAAEKNLPETLPMTHLCDHLLTVYHYMHDPQVALVMDFITGGENRPSVTPGIQVQQPHASSTVYPGGYNTELSCIMHKDSSREMAVSVEIPGHYRKNEVHRPTASVEIPSYLKTGEVHRPIVSLEIPIYLRNEEIHRPSKSAEIPSYLRKEELYRPAASVAIPSSWRNEQTRWPAPSAEIPNCLYPADIHRPAMHTETARHMRAVEFPGYVLPVEIPQHDSLFKKSRNECPKSVNLLDKSRHQNTNSAINLQETRPKKAIETPKPVKTVEKPKVICESDLVGQILMQGLYTSTVQFPSHSSGSSVRSCAKPEKLLPTTGKPAETKPPSISDIHCKDAKVTTTCIKKQTPLDFKATAKSTISTGTVARGATKTKSTISTNKVAWDVKKILGPDSSVPKKKTPVPDLPVSQKRPREVLAEDVRDEMEAKRQRLSQWLYDHATQPVKNTSSGTKRKAVLMEKSCKDHSAKRQRIGEVNPKLSTSQTFKTTAKNPDIKWIKW